MSDNSSSTSPKEDRRVVRTRDRLGDALVELLVQKPFDDITVQEVLDRARVSRSTFYQHYRDKNDLFLNDVDDFFEKMASLLPRSDDRSERVAPVAELFAHVAEVQDFYSALVASGRAAGCARARRSAFRARHRAPPARSGPRPGFATGNLLRACAQLRRKPSSYCFFIRFGFGSFILFFQVAPPFPIMSTESGHAHALGNETFVEHLQVISVGELVHRDRSPY